ncbi:DUF1552 domain-containing protein [Stratiformator vulcanicus]|uniref:DUF1552 domain-containing protein n=1 Tax=Stratiformator vulcanicus TaxID=2527980 RepID=A0A517QWW3_9PLAN|nr:DUF1552 domain-containing protein [Stratiformator vulcanicus]QDT36058.1 hypothetical protein Pan189_04130 [Stratiformator vulcanicus]
MSIRSTSRSQLSRRTVLRGVGVGLALPALDAMTPAFAKSTDAVGPQRFVAIETNQGILPQYFFAKGEGERKQTSPYLEILKPFRDRMTAFAGVSHPEVDGGHTAERCFLTAAPHPGRSGFRNTISVDQFAAERIGHLTRFPSLALAIGTKQSLSYTQSGVQIPGEDSPSSLFRKLFIQGSPEAVNAQVKKLRQGRSILDSIGERSWQLGKRLGPADRQKLDQFYTGVRDLEQRLHKTEQWELKPKARVEMDPPQDFKDPGALIEKTRAMFDLTRLAFETDSTRLISIYIHQNAAKPNIKGVDTGTHPLTHHGNQPAKLKQLRLIESAQFEELRNLLAGLDDSRTGGHSLLDETSVFYGTPLGNGNAHTNTNLPVLLAGGGFRHSGYQALGGHSDYPLPNLFVSVLQRLGIETDSFATSTGTMRGLEIV